MGVSIFRGIRPAASLSDANRICYVERAFRATPLRPTFGPRRHKPRSFPPDDFRPPQCDRSAGDGCRHTGSVEQGRFVAADSQNGHSRSAAVVPPAGIAGRTGGTGNSGRPAVWVVRSGALFGPDSAGRSQRSAAATSAAAGGRANFSRRLLARSCRRSGGPSGSRLAA